MTEIVVRPVRFTPDVGAMQRFLELIGLRPWIVTDSGGWSDMSCGAGRVALHDASSSSFGHLPGQTTMGFEADDVAVLARQLTAAGVPEVTVYDEAYGRVLTCQDPDGATVAVDERATDLYGYQLRAEPSAVQSLRVMPVRFTDPAGPYAAFVQALGLRPAFELNPYYVNFLAADGAQGLVGLHHVVDEPPVVADGRSPVVQLCFETGEQLADIAARLSAAGHAAEITRQDFGSVLAVTDPDGQQVQVHAPATAD
jgi:predicted enzyme related to lactoylglutathione lyase